MSAGGRDLTAHVGEHGNISVGVTIGRRRYAALQIADLVGKAHVLYGVGPAIGNGDDVIAAAAPGVRPGWDGEVDWLVAEPAVVTVTSTQERDL